MEGNGSRQQISIEIEKIQKANRALASSLTEKLEYESPSLSANCIFKVPWALRRRNETSYEPKMVSIGPFHHGKDRVAPMEKLKLWYLHCLLARLPLSPEEILQDFIGSIRGLAKCTTNSYAEKLDLTEDELVEMMIVDGCFLLELFRRDAWLVPRHKDDPIFCTSWMLENLFHDLILLENQIPWLVLDCLFNLTASVHEQEPNFLVVLVLKFFEAMMLMTVPAESKLRRHEIKHILGLLRSCLISSSECTEPGSSNWELIPPITDLLRSGVRFKKGTPGDILNIKFTHGVFEIPPIKIGGNSESLFRNLIAYEQCDRHCTDKFTSYGVLLDCLINTREDADLLRDKRIVLHALSTGEVSPLFNGLYNDTLVCEFHYDEVSQRVNEYYRCQWQRWRAILERDYFNNPWSISSFIAAIVILVLTFLQTVYTILSY